MSLHFNTNGLVNDNSALVQIIALCHTGEKKKSFEEIMTLFNDAYMRCSASKNWSLATFIDDKDRCFLDDIFKCSF